LSCFRFRGRRDKMFSELEGINATTEVQPRVIFSTRRLPPSKCWPTSHRNLRWRSRRARSLRRIARAAAGPVRAHCHSLGLSLGRGQCNRQPDAGGGQAGLQLCFQRKQFRQPHLGCTRQGRFHGRHRLHCHSLIHRSIQIRGRLAMLGMLDPRQPALLGPVLLSGQLGVRHLVARAAAAADRQLRWAKGVSDQARKEQRANATGLTPVHVNRTLKQLDRDGLIERQRRFVRIPDWTQLRNVAGFNEAYLHLDKLAG